MYKPIAEKNKKQIEKILKSAQSFFNTISYIFIAYLIILCCIYPKFVNSEFSEWYTISLLIIISISIFAEYYFGMVYKLYLQAEQKTYITSNIQSLTTILNTVLCIILINLKINIQVVKLISSFIFLFRPILQNIYVKKKYNINLKEVNEKYELKQKWDGLAQHIASVIHGNTDVIILTVFSNTSEISVYTVYLFVVNGVKNLIQSLTGGIDATFGDMYAREEYENLNKNFKVYEFFYFTLVTIIFTSTLCLILPFVQVYTKDITDVNYYRPLFGYLIVLAEYMWAIRLPYSSLVLAVGHFKQTQKGAWFEAISNILISLVLVYKFGIVGVTIGTLFAMTVRTIEFMYYSSKNILKRKTYFTFMKLFIIIIQSVIIFLLSRFILNNILFESYFIWIKYAIILSFTSFMVVLITNIFVYNKEFKEIIKILQRILKSKK